jgi:hypothetical protein
MSRSQQPWKNVSPKASPSTGPGFLGTWANSYLQSLGIKVTKFFDRDNRKIGGEIDGIPIAGPTRTNWHPYRLSSSLLGMLFAKCNRSWRLTVWQPCLSTAILCTQFQSLDCRQG